jgi:hypothetical protein
MNKKAILFLLPLLLLIIAAVVLVFTGTTGNVEDPENQNAAKSVRNIYIGDIITLKITSRAFGAEEFERLFQGFEIVEIRDEPDGYLLSLRTFNVGERKILLGNKEIVINVRSTLNDIKRDSIFEGDVWVIRPGFIFYWRILLYVSAGVFTLSGGLVMLRIITKRKAKALSPLGLFIKRCAALSADNDFNDNYFVDLTFYFKEYIETRYQCRIIGKTSAEIISALREIQALDAFLHEIQEWLIECDRMKFTGIEVSAEEKKGHYVKLNKLVERIDQIDPDKQADYP